MFRPDLILEHCTVEGAGLFDLTSGVAQLAVQVEMRDCAIRASALFACKSGMPPSAQIAYRGENNQFDIVGPSWLVLSASEGTPALSSAVTDLDSWLRFAPKENNPIRAKLKFVTDPRARSELAQPHDFAIEAPGPAQPKPGADPLLVGPWSNR
jgi:hypothetical protein